MGTVLISESLMEHFKIRVGVRLRPQNERYASVRTCNIDSAYQVLSGIVHREKNTCPKQMCTTSGNTLTCSTGSYTFGTYFCALSNVLKDSGRFLDF